MALVWSLKNDIGIEAAVIRNRYAFPLALPIPWGIYGTTRGKLATSRKVREFATRAPVHSGNIWPKRRLKASRVEEKDGDAAERERFNDRKEESFKATARQLPLDPRDFSRVV